MHLLLRVRPSILARFFKRLLGIKRREVQTFDGLSFFADPVSHFGNEVMTTGTYEPAMSELLRCVLRQDDSFLDIGANEGYFSMLASSLTKGLIIAVEPQSRLRDVLLRNRELNHAVNVNFQHIALGEASCNSTLFLSHDTNTGATSLVTSGSSGAAELVNTIMLDELMAEYQWPRFRLMKVDCEGFEEPIIKGATEFLARRSADFISLDYHPSIVGADAIFRLDNQMRASGYHLTQTGNGCWLYHLPGLEDGFASLGPSFEIGTDLRPATHPVTH